jgi:hypothetical protein
LIYLPDPVSIKITNAGSYTGINFENNQFITFKTFDSNDKYFLVQSKVLDTTNSNTIKTLYLTTKNENFISVRNCLDFVADVCLSGDKKENGDLNALQGMAVFSNSRIFQKVVPSKMSLSLFAITPSTTPTPLYTLMQWCFVDNLDDASGPIDCTYRLICSVSPGYSYPNGTKVPDCITWWGVGLSSTPFIMNFEIVY